MPSASTIVSDIFTTFRLHGQHRVGEAVTEELHALQCATLAGDAGESSEVIASCLLHDYGRLLIRACGKPPDHETDLRPGFVGAHRLGGWFGPEVVEPIRLQAEAMRYLCWRETGYLRTLSDASRWRLALQGGAMTDAEALHFEVNPHFPAALRVRRYDDLGMAPRVIAPAMEAFRALLQSLVERATRERLLANRREAPAPGRGGRSRLTPGFAGRSSRHAIAALADSARPR